MRPTLPFDGHEPLVRRPDREDRDEPEDRHDDVREQDVPLEAGRAGQDQQRERADEEGDGDDGVGGVPEEKRLRPAPLLAPGCEKLANPVADHRPLVVCGSP